MADISEKKFLSWNWLAGLLLAIAGALALLVVNDIRADIGGLQRDKLDKAQYYSDMQSIKESSKYRQEKIDKIYDMLYEHMKVTQGENFDSRKHH